MSNSSLRYPEELRERIRRYYQHYYAHFGIRNVEDHVANRLREEAVECQRLNRHESLLCHRFDGGLALIVGVGTGALAACLHSLGNDVYGVEPDRTALSIAQERMTFVGAAKARLIPAVAERLPYPSNTFDSIFCYTVLEHVQDVRQSLHELVRALKPGGVLLLNTSDYRFPFEGHYKVPLPLLPLPRWVSAAILKLAGKPIKPFFDEITYVTSRQIQHILMSMPNVRFFRVFEPYPSDWSVGRKARSLKLRIAYAAFRFWSRRLEVYMIIEYYIFKKPAGDEGDGSCLTQLHRGRRFSS